MLTSQRQRQQQQPALDGAEKVYDNPLLVSHPVPLSAGAAEPDEEAGTDRQRQQQHGMASPASSIGAPTPSSSAAGGGGDRHLRRMTQSLLDILEGMAGSVVQPIALAAGATGSGSDEGKGDSVVCVWRSGDGGMASWGGQQAHPPPPTNRRIGPCPAGAQLPGVSRRGDSVATMADLEAGQGPPGAATGSAAAAAAGEGASDGGGAVVPVHHVRRLTTTLVDILRHVVAGGGGSGGGGQGGGSREQVRFVQEHIFWNKTCTPCSVHYYCPPPSSPPAFCPAMQGGDLEISPSLPASEGAALLAADNSSERSSISSGSDDRLSQSSGTLTALLKASYIKDEYRGAFLCASCGAPGGCGKGVRPADRRVGSQRKQWPIHSSLAPGSAMR